ncbi:MAG: sensor histidine kinase [Paracoccaceae bacterium]
MTRRWRPSLGFVLGGALLATLGFAFCGLVALRYLGPEIGFRQAALILGAVILVLTGAVGWLLVRLLLRPIGALEDYAVAHQAGGQATPPRHFGTSELHRTAVAVMGMAETLRDREATIRSFTDHVTHEIKTPVSAIRAAVELLQDGGALTEADLRIVAQIDGAQAQIAGQLQVLRAAAQAREVRYLGRTSLAEVVPGLTGARFVVDGGDVPLPMAMAGMALVLGHLVRNAVEHGAGEVRLQATEAELRVQDDGTGISAGNRDRIFEPFFTTGRERGGTGMGLSIVRNILVAHGGEIALKDGPGPTCFVIRFRKGAV